MDDPENTLTWDEHAAGLRGHQRALAMLRALLSDDEAPLDVACCELFELIQAGNESGDYGELERYQVAQAELAIRFGRLVHGQYIDGVLRQMQEELAAHIAGYDDDPAGQQDQPEGP